jgi:hypothetical protein
MSSDDAKAEIRAAVRYLRMPPAAIARQACFRPATQARGNSASAQYDCPGGQRPVPPAVAEQMALPLCGFDATLQIFDLRLNLIRLSG